MMTSLGLQESLSQIVGVIVAPTAATGRVARARGAAAGTGVPAGRTASHRGGQPPALARLAACLAVP